MKKRVLYIFLPLLMCSALCAQKESKDLREGNGLYKSSKFTDAEISYRKGLEKNKQSFEANFNLGDALYKQGKYQEALKQFGKASDLEKDKEKVATCYHNMGNAFFKTKDYEKSIKAYKNSLKLNPKDEQTRYNLALAKTMLKKQQQQKDQNKKNKQNKQNNNDQKKDQQKQQPKPQPQQNKMSDENAKQILDAFVQDEKDVQNRVKQNQKKMAEKHNVEKDW